MPRLYAIIYVICANISEIWPKTSENGVKIRSSPALKKIVHLKHHNVVYEHLNEYQTYGLSRTTLLPGR